MADAPYPEPYNSLAPLRCALSYLNVHEPVTVVRVAGINFIPISCFGHCGYIFKTVEKGKPCHKVFCHKVFYRGTQEEWAISPTRFEEHAGKARGKNYKLTCRVILDDGTAGCTFGQFVVNFPQYAVGRTQQQQAQQEQQEDALQQHPGLLYGPPQHLHAVPQHPMHGPHQHQHGAHQPLMQGPHQHPMYNAHHHVMYDLPQYLLYDPYQHLHQLAAAQAQPQLNAPFAMGIGVYELLGHYPLGMHPLSPPGSPGLLHPNGGDTFSSD